MADDLKPLEQHSKTLKRSKESKMLVFGTALTGFVALATAIGGLHWVVQGIMGTAMAVFMFLILRNLGLIDRYRRDDFSSGKRRNKAS
jgi:hypothetical protein